MQDRYAGDIGDFAKYALLRSLAGSDLRLGVVWFLNPNEESTADGKFTHYPRLRECDVDLYDRIQAFLEGGARRIARIEQADILPAETSFYSQPLTFCDLPPSNQIARRHRRERWLAEAFAATAQSDIVFLDPDNGFAPGDPAAAHKKKKLAKGAKYVFFDELLPYLNRDQSLVVYHHHGRLGDLPAQRERVYRGLQTSGSRRFWALTFHGQGGARSFFVIAAHRLQAILLDRSRRFVETEWGKRGGFRLWLPGEPLHPANVPPLPRIGKAAPSETVHRDLCEAWDGEAWNSLSISEALEARRMRRWRGGRCIECHAPVRAHKKGANGQRAHFEHLARNPDCGRGSK
jgi:hypothetical protein